MNISKLAAFTGKVLLCLLLFAGVAPWLIPAYDILVSEATNSLFPGLANTSILIEVYASYFNIGLLFALFVATPFLKPRQRLTHVLTGLILLFGLHIATRALTLSGLIGLQEGYDYGSAWLFVFSETGQYIWPLVIWAGLTFRYWFPSPRAERNLSGGSS